MLDFAGFFYQSRDIGFITDTRGAILAVTQGAQEALGHSQMELVGLDLPHLSAGEDLSSLFAAAEPPRSRMHVAFHLRTKAGPVLEVDAWASCLRDASGSHVGWFFAGQDLRGSLAEARGELEKSVEERTAELRQSEERFRGAFAHTGIGMCLVGPDGRFLQVNRSLCEMLGYTERELLDVGFKDVTHPEDRERSLELAGRMLSGELPHARLEKRYIHKEGRVVWAYLTTTLLRDAQGRPACFVSGIQDVTERKEAEERLKDSEERYRLLFDTNPQPMWVYDLETLRFLAVNDSAVRHYGYSRDQFLAMTLRDIRPPEEGPRAPESASRIKEGLDETGYGRHRKKDGTLIDVQITSHPLTYMGRRAELVLANDVTIRRRAEEALRKAHEDLERRVQERTAELAQANELLRSQIAERRRAEENLKLYREIFAHANEGISIIDPSGVCIDQNDAHRALTGYSDEDLRGRTPAFYDPDGFARVMEAIRQKGSFRGEVSNVTKSGAMIHVEISAFPIRSAAGEILCYVAIKRDVTGRRRAEEAMRLYREIISNATEAVAIIDPVGHYREQNAAHRELFGYSDEELRAKTPAIYMGEEVFSAMARELAEKGSYRGEVVTTTKTGRRVDIELSAFTMRDASGGVLCHVGIKRDITARKQAEETLRFQKTLLESQSESAIDGILVVSKEGKMISFNRRFVEMWDIPREIVESRSDEAALQSVLDKLVDPPGFLSRVRYLYDHPDEESRDELALKDGRVFDRYSAPVRSLDGVHYGRVWYFRDVTGRKRTEVELRRAAEETRRAYDDLKQAQAQLIRSEKLASIGTLVSGVAHEINNPLNVMYGNLQLLAKACGHLSPLAMEAARRRKIPGVGARIRKLKGMIRDGLKAAEHARSIVEDFRNFARDTRTAEPVDLNVCLEETTSLLQRELQPSIRLVKRLRPVPPVRCFRGQINQVFLNLLKNAAEAIEKKGTITLRTRRRDSRVIVEVADTGRGMSEEVREKLFEPFFTTKPVGKGLGLGLSISAMIVQNHGGQISVRSRPGHGSVFRIELPIRG